jgi:hypothetical protein
MTRGVNAPGSLLMGGVEERDFCAPSLVGDGDRGVEILLALDEPRVAATDGEAGGSGERVK